MKFPGCIDLGKFYATPWIPYSLDEEPSVKRS
jgi:hypothetical protein